MNRPYFKGLKSPVDILWAYNNFGHEQDDLIQIGIAAWSLGSCSARRGIKKPENPFIILSENDCIRVWWEEGWYSSWGKCTHLIHNRFYELLFER